MEDAGVTQNAKETSKWLMASAQNLVISHKSSSIRLAKSGQLAWILVDRQPRSRRKIVGNTKTSSTKLTKRSAKNGESKRWWIAFSKTKRKPTSKSFLRNTSFFRAYACRTLNYNDVEWLRKWWLRKCEGSVKIRQEMYHLFRDWSSISKSRRKHSIFQLSNFRKPGWLCWLICCFSTLTNHNELSIADIEKLMTISC